MKALKLILLIPLFFLMACSAAYDQVKEMDIKNPNTFQKHLLNNYKINASFEAEKMHDWNSAKLYSEKALRALDGENIYPEEITYWKLPTKIAKDISSSYDNLLSIYDEAIIKDPKNLAKAISSLDCWAEQEEEKWQTWDIDKCKNDFHTAMHGIYNFLTEEDEKKEFTKVIEKEEEDDTPQVVIVTENEKKEVMQIIYFDFDNSKLSEVSKNTLSNFLDKNKKKLSRYIIFGHTDTKGSSKYNMNLSIKRAESVKEALLDQGITPDDISILGKGENELAIDTPDNTKHPVNRRAEVKILN
ncbi:OmpA family protein [Alphaproteobacteria bacterium]|nr:OmpA family protein [Alphaproteobacteria bacterium]MDC3270421.1 OmpA family protein [Alphaproteobacteria bacterium]